MEQLTKNQAVATSQEAVQNQNEPQLRDENAHNDKSVHGVLNPTYQAGLRRDAVQPRSEERFSRNAETDLVCRLLLEKKNTVRAPGEPSHDILLELPGPPSMDEKTASQFRELISKGASGFAAGFTTSDAKKTYETLKAKGVDIADDITERDYGTDFGIRDPFGNHIRVVQLSPTSHQLGPKKAAAR